MIEHPQKITVGLPDDAATPMLVIGPQDRLAIEMAMAQARATPGTPICVRIPKGYDAIVSIEEHPIGRLLHLSVGMGGKRPPLDAVEMIAAEFGIAPNSCIDFWLDQNHAANLLKHAPAGGSA